MKFASKIALAHDCHNMGGNGFIAIPFHMQYSFVPLL